MELFVNGEIKTCAESVSLADFIEQLGMKGDRVAVELSPYDLTRGRIVYRYK